MYHEVLQIIIPRILLFATNIYYYQQWKFCSCENCIIKFLTYLLFQSVYNTKFQRKALIYCSVIIFDQSHANSLLTQWLICICLHRWVQKLHFYFTFWGGPKKLHMQACHSGWVRQSRRLWLTNYHINTTVWLLDLSYFALISIHLHAFV